jgi:AAA+ superfamily predicted ATPase
MCETKGFPDLEKAGDDKEGRKLSQELRAKVEDFNLNNIGEYNGFIAVVSTDKIDICFAARENPIPFDKVTEFLALLGRPEASFALKEITMKSFISNAERAERRGFIEDTTPLYEDLGIDDFSNSRRSRCFSEKVIGKSISKEQLIKRAKTILCAETLLPEIERIYAGGSAVVRGHPVHYMIQSDNKKVIIEVVEILISALASNNRLVSKRYANYRFESDDCVDSEYRSLCKSMSGGTIAIICEITDAGESEFADRGADILVDIAEISRMHRNSLLTILCLPQKCERMADLFLDNAGAVSFVTIREEAVFADNAKAYLKSLARQAGAKPDRALYKAIEDGKGYLGIDLDSMFEKWFDKHLKTRVYKQYEALETADMRLAAKMPKGSAFSELCEMIGLSSAKDVISQALDFYKAQKLFRDMGIDRERPAMHMVFTGNPGTAKTSVARLFARIMKENSLLRIGELREVGRADLVDRYLGGTAPRVKNHFKKAAGSVLFIDEAYSLVDDKDGLYGDEAINTIVQEMENARDDTVVIFAGYPDKMEGFLSKNPGLRSRIAFHVHFDDYSTDELYEILELMAKNHKMKLADGVSEIVMPMLESATKSADAGNGRYVRNMFEKAKMKQASRLVRSDVGSVIREDVFTLIGDDFDAPKETKREPRKIGFVQV